MKLDFTSVLDVVNRHSLRALAAESVFFSCTGGIWLGKGVAELIFGKSSHTWISSLLLGSAFLAWGIFWVVMLVRRAHSAGSTSS